MNSESFDFESFDSDFYNQPKRARRDSFDSITLPPSSPTRTKRKKPKRPKVLPSQGDAVLIGFLANSGELPHYEIARDAGQIPLDWTTGSESTENEMEDGSGIADGNEGNIPRTTPQPDATSAAAAAVTEALKAHEAREACQPDVKKDGEAGTDVGLDSRDLMDLDLTSTDHTTSTEKPTTALGVPTTDPPVDPELVLKDQEMREGSALATTDPVLESIDLTGSSSETAASLISLAGGALDIHQRAYSASASYTTDGNWTGQGEPSSPESSKPKPLNAAGNDGKHPTLPPLEAMGLLAELATKTTESPQQGIWPQDVRLPVQQNCQNAQTSCTDTNDPSGSQATPPAGQNAFNGAADGAPRPPMHHLSLQARREYMTGETSAAPYYPQHQHYPPIKDTVTTTSSPQTSYAATAVMQSTTPNSVNLFAQMAAGGFEDRRQSSSSDFQYSSETTPQGPSTGETMSTALTDDSVVSPQQQHMQQPIMQATPAQQIQHTGQMTNQMTAQMTAQMAGGGFKCVHPGCKAPPFQTQYLLK